MNGIGTLLFILITKGQAPAFWVPVLRLSRLLLLSLQHRGSAMNMRLVDLWYPAWYSALQQLLLNSVGQNGSTSSCPPAAMGAVIALIGLELSRLWQPTWAVWSLAILIPNWIRKNYCVCSNTGNRSVRLGSVPQVPVCNSDSYRDYRRLYGCLLHGNGWFSIVEQAEIFAIQIFSLQKFDLSRNLDYYARYAGSFVGTYRPSACYRKNCPGAIWLKSQGLHRTMLGDGLSTAISGLFGSVPTTTYGENISGVMAITKVYSVWVLGGAAVLSMVIAFIRKISAAIEQFPDRLWVVLAFCCMVWLPFRYPPGRPKVGYSRSRNLCPYGGYYGLPAWAAPLTSRLGK